MRALLATIVVVAATATPIRAASVAPDLERALADSTYVYIATQRKDGTFSSPAEIWFMWHDGAVWVASPPTTWRAKRIRAGRRSARIYVGKKDGPMLTATGSLVRDPATYDRLFATYAKKYPEGWPKYEARFRDGLKDGSRVLIRYEPQAAVAASASPARPSPHP
jgi:hypothetical protein